MSDDYDITPDLAPFTNRYRWEQHLTDAQRYRLAWYRSVAAEDDEAEGIFFVELQANREGREFLDALDEAGDDPVARAEAFYFLHLDSYPFWLGEAREAEEGEAGPFEPLV
jgi:hypothetical protein